MQPDQTSAERLDDSELDQFLEQYWAEISGQAIPRAAAKVVWNRRLEQVNRVLVAAVVVMTVQSSWGAVTLLRLLNGVH
jgi:hypothetical protein